MGGVSVDKFPQTFRDVFSVVQMLGYNFVWIDALCICQDSLNQADWIEESAKMHFIYGNAALTIVSNTTADPSQGLFNENSVNFSDMLQGEKLLFPLTTPEGETSQLLLVKNPDILLTDMTDEEISKPFRLMRGPASERGWTFQERILSPRILHFNRSQIIWECKETYETEDGIKKVMIKGFPQSTLASIIRALPTGTPTPNVENYDQRCVRLGMWYTQLIVLYMTRKLTKPSDKLPALSGLSHCFAPYLHGMTFVAGIWIPNCPIPDAQTLDLLVHGLLWYRSPNKTLTRPPQYRAPSFSWASVDGEVIYSREFFFNDYGVRHLKDYSCLLNVEMKPHLEESLREIKPGEKVWENEHDRRAVIAMLNPHYDEVEWGPEDDRLKVIAMLNAHCSEEVIRNVDKPVGIEDLISLERRFQIPCRFPEEPCNRFPIRLDIGYEIEWSCCGYRHVFEEVMRDRAFYLECRAELGIQAFELIGVTQKHKTDDRFGQVDWAELKLNGFLQRGLSYNKTYTLHRNHRPVGFVLLDFNDTSSDQICYLPLGSNDHVAFCLMLRPSASSGDGNAYNRVGVAGIHEDYLDLTSREVITLV
jgi:hypothetical protein